MADQPNVFDTPVVQAPTQQEQQQAPATSDASYADLLKLIKNEEGQQKYDSLPKALEGLVNAQQFIPQLKTELQQKEAELTELRAKLAQQASIEEVVSRLAAKPNQTQVVEQPLQTSGLDEKAVMDLLEQRLAQREQTAKYELNTQQVQSALVAKYGDKASEVIAARATALGTTPQELGKLASQNPAMVLELFNTSAPKGPTPTTSSLNTSTFQTHEQAPLQRPTKSLLSGATSKQQAEFMRQIKADVYRRNGITS